MATSDNDFLDLARRRFKKPSSHDSNEDLLERGKRYFRLACEAEEKQREREREDLAFQVPENQWTEAARRERAGNAVTPPRPMLSISLLHQPLQLVQNQAASAKLGVSLHPVSESADDELAEIKQGLYRRIERDGNADQARLWALDRAKQCGRGWYRVNTQWDEDGDDPLDQEIVFERILYQESVYPDPSAQQPDYSDGEYVFVVARVPIEKFRREYPDADISRADFDLEGWSKNDPEWVYLDGELTSVLVAEWFYKVHDHERIAHNGRTRSVDRVTVRRAVLTACEVLEDEEWNGRLIPIVPVVGRELQPFNGERRWEGMVRPARDGQMLFNYAASTLVERMALEPKTPFIGAEGQFEGHENEWQQANTRNMPYLEYRPATLDGKPVPPPQRAQIDGSGMSLALMALQEGKGFVQNATAVYEPSLGEMPQRRDAQSGRAILALQQQADAGTSNYIQNLASISMPYEARVILDLMPTIYDRPGRIVRVLGGDDETKTIMLNRPFVLDRTGQPVPAMDSGQRGAKHYDLSKGKYSISVSIGKSHQTRLEHGAADMGEILAAQPQLVPIIGDLYFKFRDFPGAKEISERLAKLRESQFPSLSENKDGQPTPEQLQAQVQAQGQQMQALQQQLQMALRQIETDRAKQEAVLAKAQMDNETKLAIAKLDQITTLLKENARQDESALMRAYEDQARHEKMAHDVGMSHGTSQPLREDEATISCTLRN